MNLTRIEKGIAAYAHEQTVLLRLLRRRGSFTAREFDKWLGGREWRRPRIRSRAIDGDTFIIGGHRAGMWTQWLELMQHMMTLDLIDTRRWGGDLIYIPGSAFPYK